MFIAPYTGVILHTNLKARLHLLPLPLRSQPCIFALPLFGKQCSYFTDSAPSTFHAWWPSADPAPCIFFVIIHTRDYKQTPGPKPDDVYRSNFLMGTRILTGSLKLFNQSTSSSCLFFLRPWCFFIQRSSLRFSEAFWEFPCICFDFSCQAYRFCLRKHCYPSHILLMGPVNSAFVEFSEKSLVKVKHFIDFFMSPYHLITLLFNGSW